MERNRQVGLWMVLGIRVDFVSDIQFETQKMKM